MAGMFCSIEEAAQRLGKTEEELKQMIDNGALREFRDGPNLLLKVKEIEEVARLEGIELSAEAVQDDAPPPLATIPTTLETEPEELEMKEPEIPDLDPLETPDSDEADLDAGELQSLDDDLPDLDLPDLDLPDLDLPDLGAIGGDEIPALDADEAIPALEVPFAEEEPPAKKPKAKAKAKAKAKRKPKPKKQPKARPIKVHASTVPSRSFGQWLMEGLRDDSIVAIFVLLLLLCLIVAGVVGAGYGALFAVSNLL